MCSIKAGRLKVTNHTLPKDDKRILPEHVSNAHAADYKVTQELVYSSTFSKAVLHCITSYNPLTREAQMISTCVIAFKPYQSYKRFLFIHLFLIYEVRIYYYYSTRLVKFYNGLNRDLPFPWTNLNILNQSHSKEPKSKTSFN